MVAVRLGKYLWLITVLVSVGMAEGVTIVMGLLLKGEITYDYLVTGLVAALLVSALAARGLMRMQHLEMRREEEVAKNRDLRASEQRYRTMLEVANDAILILDTESGALVDCNQQAEMLMGMARQDIIESSPIDVNEGAWRSAGEAGSAKSDVVRHMLQGGATTTEFTLRRADGTTVPVEVSSSSFEMEGRGYIHGAVRDISQRKQAEERLRLLANVFEYASNPILVTDAHNRIVEMNPAFTELTGYTLADIRGQNPRIFASEHTPKHIYRAMWEGINQDGYWQGELTNRRKDGSAYIGILTISVLRDETGRIHFHLAHFLDITQRRAAEDQIKHLAHHDPLTELPNRARLQVHLEEAVEFARREALQVAVMFIDLDNFKMINDTLGHPTGDSLLKEVADRLTRSVRQDDVVARVGGDEFVVVMTGLEASKAVITTASRILESVSLPYRLEGRQLHSGASIGIAVFPAHGDTAEMLMKHADIAMYHAKSQGRNNYQFFSSAIDAEYRERMEIETDLREALEQGSFSLRYQPQVDMVTNRICCIEALVRWNHPRRGEVPPAIFIPIAEGSKLILPLGIWVITEACHQMRTWRDAGLDGVHIAINVSVIQLQDKHFVECLLMIMGDFGISGSEIEVEITESAVMENLAYVQNALKQLREAGVCVAIDDFGTGYSSLGRLKLLPIQCLKIDQSFVEDIECDPGDAKICTGIVALAHSLGLRTVAEGVETEEQKAYLSDLSCDAIQGHLISAPLSADEVLDFIWRFNKERLIRFPAQPTSRKS